MAPTPPVPRRGTFLALSLAVAAACFVGLYFLLIGGRMMLAALVVVGGLVVLACLQYLLWGRPMKQVAQAPPRRGP